MIENNNLIIKTNLSNNDKINIRNVFYYNNLQFFFFLISLIVYKPISSHVCFENRVTTIKPHTVINQVVESPNLVKHSEARP